MANLWDGDVQLTIEDAAALLNGQFPAFAPVRLSHLGTGWDNAAYLANEKWVFRFPRRAVAKTLLAVEMRVLPLLAPQLPLPVPLPLWAGTPAENYPYPFAGYALIPGTTACQWQWTDVQRAQNAIPLARFLSRLHQIPLTPEIVAWAPTDEIERAHVIKRAPKVIERLQGNRNHLSAQEIVRLTEIIASLKATPMNTAPYCWVHGDLYPRHLLMDSDKKLCGVIDWGDVHYGDPAIDLSIAFSFLPPAARRVFRDAYGPIDDATWRRARFRALHYGAVLCEYGASIDEEAMRKIGLYALQSAGTDDI